MTATAPITQDVLTLPRKPSEGPVNLIGLSRSALVDYPALRWFRP